MPSSHGGVAGAIPAGCPARECRTCGVVEACGFATAAARVRTRRALGGEIGHWSSVILSHKTHRSYLTNDHHGTVRQPAERPSSNLESCGFDSHSCHSRQAGFCLRTCGGPPGRLLRPPSVAMWVRFPPGALGNAECGTRNSELGTRIGNPNSEFPIPHFVGLVLPTARIPGCQPGDAVQFPHEPLNNDGPFVRGSGRQVLSL